MKTLRLYGAGLLVALLLALAACGTSGGGSGGSGGGGGGGSSTTVTVKQLGNGSSLVYYRVGSGNWQSLTLSGGQGTFTATGEYEVAARCDYDYTLHLFKASTSYRNQVAFTCGNVSGPSTRGVEFTVTLPSSVGGVSPQNGDGVFVGPDSPRTYTGTNPVTVNAENLKTGAGSVAITLHRPSLSPSGISTTPYGYKVVSLGASDTSVTVDGSGWQGFTSTRSLSASMPAGFQGGAFVIHFRDTYLTSAVVGLVVPSGGSSVTSQYGLLPSGGVYVGIYNAVKVDSFGSPDTTLTVARDTGGSDWSVTPPAPWASGQFSVSGDTLTFGRTDARAFNAELSGLAQRTGGTPVNLQIFVQAASSGSTTYRIPVVPGLDYELVNNPGTVYFSLEALVRDRGADLYLLYLSGDLLGAPGFPTEAELSGIDVAIAEKRGVYSGSSYTLP
jgi:hypothetical protein